LIIYDERKEGNITARKDVDPVVSQVQSEQNQSHETRKKLYIKLETELKRPVVAFFTSFNYPVMINDSDADMFEGLLQKMDLSNGVAVIINSPGGSGLAAERIIKACRTYSGTNEYIAIVPGKAKSAATMVCLGAEKIFMGPVSELGPIDPQVPLETGEICSAFNIIKSYNELFKGAVDTKGHVEPYLQQLKNYDQRLIEEYKMAQALSEDIAIKSLETGMMKGRSKEEIREKIKVLLTPEETKVHGRPIYRDEAENYGLKIEKLEPNTQSWKLLYELYIRSNNFVSTKVSKTIESKYQAWIASAPKAAKK
jgi:hypothetical protein